MTEEIYELISLSIEGTYALDVEDTVTNVCEEEPAQTDGTSSAIECDADGIYNKAARSYESTKAVFRLTEILEKAQLVEELPAKPNNRNQKGFSKMLIMRYGNIKLTVGCQRTKNENVQYGITVPQK